MAWDGMSMLLREKWLLDKGWQRGQSQGDAYNRRCMSGSYATVSISSSSSSSSGASLSGTDGAAGPAGICICAAPCFVESSSDWASTFGRSASICVPASFCARIPRRLSRSSRITRSSSLTAYKLSRLAFSCAAWTRCASRAASSSASSKRSSSSSSAPAPAASLAGGPDGEKDAPRAEGLGGWRAYGERLSVRRVRRVERRISWTSYSGDGQRQLSQ